MKSLDLQQIGLQELTTFETRSVDGGGWMAYVLGMIVGCFDNLADYNASANEISLIDNKFA